MEIILPLVALGFIYWVFTYSSSQNPTNNIISEFEGRYSKLLNLLKREYAIRTVGTHPPQHSSNNPEGIRLYRKSNDYYIEIKLYKSKVLRTPNILQVTCTIGNYLTEKTDQFEWKYEDEKNQNEMFLRIKEDIKNSDNIIF